MSIITEMLDQVTLPKMVKIRQKFPAAERQDVAQTVREQLAKPELAGRVKPGMRVALAVGSRGMTDISLIVRVVVAELKKLGAEPFIVPAMGSHGGATAEGQSAVLAGLGVTAESAGCPILSSMETVELGVIESSGLPVLIDKHAFEADGIVVINRIKGHNAFSGAVESGLSKMISIGLGKQKGADACHAFGFKHMAEQIIAMAEIKLAKANFLFGVGTVENAYDRITRLVAVLPEDIIATDKRLLPEAKANLPKILFEHIDVLVVDQLGKEFSGGGMDVHTIGRSSTDYARSAVASPERLVVLDVTDYSHGNCCGMGLADLVTRRLFNKIDFEVTYANVLTSTGTRSGRIPLIMDSDRLAIQGAAKTCGVPDSKRLRLVRIPNSLHLEEIYISESMLPEAKACADIDILTQPREWTFDAAGNLNDIGFAKKEG